MHGTLNERAEICGLDVTISLRFVLHEPNDRCSIYALIVRLIETIDPEAVGPKSAAHRAGCTAY